MNTSSPAVPATTRVRGIALVVIGGALAVAMVLALLQGLAVAASAVMLCILLLSLTFAGCGISLLKTGAISKPLKGVALAMMALTVVFILVLKEQLMGA